MSQKIAKQKSLDYEHGTILLSHGSGGRDTHILVEELFLNYFDNEYLLQRNDQALFSVPEGKMVMSTDGHVVSPIFFPGGDIGSLSIYGTVNDVSLSGATPLYLSAGIILEEGFLLSDLKKIVISMAKACERCKTPIITGDTKVVERGKGDGIFITTTGVGIIPPQKGQLNLSSNNLREGDLIIINGTIGDHGMAILSTRKGLSFTTSLKSDSSPLHDLISKMTDAVPTLRCMRDPTRGGVAATLHEFALSSQVGIKLFEKNFPILESVEAGCELLGLDPLYLANEGKVIAVCPPSEKEKLLSVMKAHPDGVHSAVIGEVVKSSKNQVFIETAFKGERLLSWPSGEQLPRIC